MPSLTETNSGDLQEQAIEAIDVPLSHLEDDSSIKQRSGKTILRIALGALGLLVLVTVFVWEPTKHPDVEDSTKGPRPVFDNTRTQVSPEVVAPFESIVKNQADEAARTTINQYMNLVKRVNKEIFIDPSDEELFLQSEQSALEGDRLYYAGDFKAAQEQYEEARKQIANLIAQTETTFKAHIQQALLEVQNLNSESARTAITNALRLKPESDEAIKLAHRIDALPEVINLLRTAKNQELSRRYADALKTYQRIKLADPLIKDIDLLIIQIKIQLQTTQLQELLTQGFAFLDMSDFESARKAFQKALNLDSANLTAIAGLEQIALNKDLFIIKEKNVLGEKALNQGRWKEAKMAYEEILEIDPNIQSAIKGKALAVDHERLERLLSNIAAEPFKLSSETLFLEAKDILKDSQALTYKNDKLAFLIQQITELIAIYSQPVNLTLISDNATDVLISNIGRLGKFTKKIISVRPGKYTIRGSQLGCKDIYRTINVLPDAEPVSVMCEERFN